MAAGAHVPLRFLRAAVKKGIAILKTRIPAAQQTTKSLEPIYARVTQNPHLHPAIRQRVSGRWYSTSVHNFLRFSSAKASGRAVQAPPVRAALGRITASPFASTLRPKLVGGAFPRTAGGYSLGGGARYFSHSPAAPAQVVSQVSTAMRAFMNSGKGQMDSYRRSDGKAGRVGVRAQLAASLAQENAPGAYVDFDLSPNFTSLTPLNRNKPSLEDSEFLQGLAADFGAMLGGITAIYGDIRKLSALGDLPVTLVGPKADVLRVHFRGCDREFVERLCTEVGITRGVVHEDERFAFEMLAQGVVPSWRDMMSSSPPASSTYSEDGLQSEYSSEEVIRSRISGSDSLDESDYFDIASPHNTDPEAVFLGSSEGGSNSSTRSGYDGLEGIHRFLSECDEYRLSSTAWA